MNGARGSVLVLALVGIAVLAIGAFALIEGVTMDVDVARRTEQAAIRVATYELALVRAEQWLVANAFWLVARCRESADFSTVGGGAWVKCLDEVDGRLFFHVAVYPPGAAADANPVLESTYAIGGASGGRRHSWRRN